MDQTTPKPDSLDSAMLVTMTVGSSRATRVKLERNLYTSRIYERPATKSHSKTAWLVASATCRRGRGCLEQYRASRTRGNGHKGVIGTAYLPDRGANDAK
jgi:hypothetical protein